MTREEWDKLTPDEQWEAYNNWVCPKHGECAEEFLNDAISRWHKERGATIQGRIGKAVIYEPPTYDIED